MTSLSFTLDEVIFDVFLQIDTGNKWLYVICHYVFAFPRVNLYIAFDCVVCMFFSLYVTAFPF